MGEISVEIGHHLGSRFFCTDKNVPQTVLSALKRAVDEEKLTVYASWRKEQNGFFTQHKLDKPIPLVVSSELDTLPEEVYLVTLTDVPLFMVSSVEVFNKLSRAVSGYKLNLVQII